MLKSIIELHISWIKTIDVGKLTYCLKTDYLLLKNFILIGKIQRCDEGGFWRKVTPRTGVPLYLKNLISKLQRMSPFDKCLFLTFFRMYRLLE